jgi:hypothetical protein
VVVLAFWVKVQMALVVRLETAAAVGQVAQMVVRGRHKPRLLLVAIMAAVVVVFGRGIAANAAALRTLEMAATVLCVSYTLAARVLSHQLARQTSK